eukprot:1233313-Prymnesium_polylepis.2
MCRNHENRRLCGDAAGVFWNLAGEGSALAHSALRDAGAIASLVSLASYGKELVGEAVVEYCRPHARNSGGMEPCDGRFRQSGRAARGRCRAAAHPAATWPRRGGCGCQGGGRAAQHGAQQCGQQGDDPRAIRHRAAGPGHPRGARRG